MDTSTFSPGDAGEYSPSIYIFVMGIILTKSFECHVERHPYRIIITIIIIHDGWDSDCVIRTSLLEWGHQRLEVCGLYLKNFYPQQGGRAFHRNGISNYCYTHDCSFSWLRRLKKNMTHRFQVEQIVGTRWMKENEGLCVMWQLNG